MYSRLVHGGFHRGVNQGFHPGFGTHFRNTSCHLFNEHHVCVTAKGSTRVGKCYTMKQLAANPQLEQLSLPTPLLTFEVVAAWHHRSSQDPLHQWIIVLLKQQFQL